ncbi:MAG: acetyl-CoA carboxylase biotin carboxyl carrier protein subunit [Betaproteobacteria bacterium]|nr:acetyl-CoA carboxylase biotin carboxyl carrier protein subunit [Betaproteobacteria bacterium]
MATYEARSEVTGSVWKVVCEVGQRLEPGDTVMIIESMKMEIPVIAEDGGVVKQILVEKGTPVTENQPVAILEVE